MELDIWEKTWAITLLHYIHTYAICVCIQIDFWDGLKFKNGDNELIPSLLSMSHDYHNKMSVSAIMCRQKVTALGYGLLYARNVILIHNPHQTKSCFWAKLGVPSVCMFHAKINTPQRQVTYNPPFLTYIRKYAGCEQPLWKRAIQWRTDSIHMYTQQ